MPAAEDDTLLVSAVKWSAELDRCLRSPDPAVQVQGVLSIAPGIRCWGETPLPCARDSSSTGAHGSGDDLDEELALANSLALKLADAFKAPASAPALRIAITKLLLHHLDGQTQPLASLSPSDTWLLAPDTSAFTLQLRAAYRGRSPGHEALPGWQQKQERPSAPGFFSKQRLLSSEEFLRRICEVAAADASDSFSTALALRAIGCVAPLAAADVAAQSRVLKALYSDDPEVVKSALFASSFLLEVSAEFARALEDTVQKIQAKWGLDQGLPAAHQVSALGMEDTEAAVGRWCLALGLKLKALKGSTHDIHGIVVNGP